MKQSMDVNRKHVDCFNQKDKVSLMSANLRTTVVRKTAIVVLLTELNAVYDSLSVALCLLNNCTNIARLYGAHRRHLRCIVGHNSVLSMVFVSSMEPLNLKLWELSNRCFDCPQKWYPDEKDRGLTGAAIRPPSIAVCKIRSELIKYAANLIGIGRTLRNRFNRARRTSRSTSATKKLTPAWIVPANLNGQPYLEDAASA